MNNDGRVTWFVSPVLLADYELVVENLGLEEVVSIDLEGKTVEGDPEVLSSVAREVFEAQASRTLRCR